LIFFLHWQFFFYKSLVLHVQWSKFEIFFFGFLFTGPIYNFIWPRVSRFVIFCIFTQLSVQSTTFWIVSVSNDFKAYYIFSWCSFSMMVEWANDGLLQANDVKCLLMMVKCKSMMLLKWVYDHILISKSLTSISPIIIINEHFTIINEHFTIISLKLNIVRSFDHRWEAAPTDIMLTYWKLLNSFYLTKIKTLLVKYVTCLMHVPNCAFLCVFLYND